MPNRAAVFTLAALALSCSKEQQQPDSEPPAPVAATEEPDPSKEAAPMGEHFLQASKIKDKIIYGELASTKSPAQWLIDNVVADQLPVKWRPHVPRVHDGANMVIKAEDFLSAAQGAAEIGLQCGACHQDVGVDVMPKFEPPPLDDSTTFGHMDRHGYAVDRMWAGLVGPSDEAWKDGANMLIEAPKDDNEQINKEKELANKVHGLAASAANQEDPAERAGHFAQILATCAECHQKTRG